MSEEHSIQRCLAEVLAKKRWQLPQFFVGEFVAAAGGPLHLASWLANPDAWQPSEVGSLLVLHQPFGSVASMCGVFEFREAKAKKIAVRVQDCKCFASIHPPFGLRSVSSSTERGPMPQWLAGPTFTRFMSEAVRWTKCIPGCAGRCQA